MAASPLKLRFSTLPDAGLMAFLMISSWVLPACGGTVLTMTAAFPSAFTIASASAEFWNFHPGGAVIAMPSGS